MLSRTAENLYWIARHIERAETTARLLEVGYRISMMPSADGGYQSEWESIIATSGVASDFHEHYTEITQDNVCQFLIHDERNPSSIKQCIKSARENARSARTALTSEVWETINHTYIRFQQMESWVERRQPPLQELCDWTKRRSAMLRGVFDTTQIQSQGSDFFNLGYYVERADNTARLLDMKYYVLLPTIDMIGGGVDIYQWFALLRSLSVRRSFHWVYHGDYSPEKIAHFLILNPDCPRSLLHCVDKVEWHLSRLSRVHGNQSDAHTYIQTLLEEMRAYEIEDIISAGLHEFLSDFIVKNARMTDEIANSYLFGH